jgi:hypothetical protein
LPAYAQRVAANQGEVHWASGARPRSCGLNCLGHPFMTAQDQRNQPNLRRAQAFGRITLTIDPTGPTNRDVVFGYDAFFTCRTENGARNGNLVMELRFGQPVISDPGIIEGIVSNVFTAGELSRFVESEIRRQLPNLGSAPASTVGSCRSVGVATNSDANFDAIKFDLPASGPRVRNTAAVTNAIRQQARIEVLRIVRNPLPPLVAPEHASPGDPMSGQFTVFLNGASHFIPPQGLVLPATGGSAAINFCTTIDVTGWDQLQILFTNDLGGAAWSQFTEGANFGQGGIRTLTTSRTIVVPGRPGLPDPRTGRPRPARPETMVLREFELTYRITFTGPPTTATTAPSANTGGIRPGVLGQVIGTRPTTAVDAATPPSAPCREI